MPSYKLTYWEGPGRAEPVRLAFVVGGIPFEDVRVDYQRVASMRASGELPFSQVPALQLGDDAAPRHAQPARRRALGRQHVGRRQRLGRPRLEGEDVLLRI